ncbi:MAG: hypothetical protein KAI22_08335 [Gammaproteobacteria bacterium]|nr:hypothetical protein [Gammaproteobacteria bacterium]
MNITTGKAIVSLYDEQDNIILVDIYADGELNRSDVDNIHEAISNFNVPMPVDTICVKSGQNYLSEEAFEYSIQHNCIHNKVVYVITHMTDIHFPSQAQETYFKDHLVDYCTSVDEARQLLKKSSLQSLKHCPS